MLQCSLLLAARSFPCLSFLFQKKSGWEDDRMEVKLKENKFLVVVGKNVFFSLPLTLI